MASDIEFLLKAKDSGASKNLNNVSGALKNTKTNADNLKSSTGGLWKSMLGGQAAFAVVQKGLRALTGFFTESIDKAIEQERVEKLLNQVIESTGGAAGLSAIELKNLATELQGVTTYGDEAVIGAENLLLTFTNIGKEVFPQATEMTLNMSTALGQDLKSSAVQLGKALNDPVRGVTALQRVGVSFTAQQKEVIAKMMETNNIADAQGIVMAELERQFGGAARAAADTFGGSITQLQNVFGDYQEKVGDTIIQSSAFQGAIQSLKDVFSDPDFIKATQLIVEGMINVVQGLANAVGFAIDAVKAIVGALQTYSPVIRTIIEGWQNLLVLFTDEMSRVEEKQMEVINRGADQAKLVFDKFKDMRDELGLTTPELVKMKTAFAGIEDPALRMSKIMQAIKRGKFDTDARKLSVEYDAWQKKLKETRSKLVEVKKEVDGKSGIIQLTKDQKETLGNLSTEQDSYQKKLGLLAQNEIKEATKQIDFLSAAFLGDTAQAADNWQQLGKNQDALDKVKIEVQGLIDKFKQAGLDIPPAAQAVADKINQIETDAYLARDASKALHGQFGDVSAMFKAFPDKSEPVVYQLKVGKEKSDLLTQSFEGLSQIGNEMIGVLEGLGLISGDLAAALGGVVSSLSGFGAGIKAIGTDATGLTGIISKVSGWVSIASAALTLLSSAFSLFKGKSGEMEAAERRLSGLSAVSGDWLKKIEELGKQLGNAGADRAFNALLGEIIADTTVTIGTFDTFIVKVREIVSAFEDGNASLEETETNFGNAFDAMVLKAQELGQEGGVAMTGLILLADEFGLSVQSVADYIESNMKSAVDGWRDAVKVFGDVALPILDDMLALENLIGENQTLVDGINGARLAIEGLSAAGRLTQGEFDAFQQIAVQGMADLQAAGFDAADALSKDVGLQGILQKLIFLSNEFGFAIDADTQALIDQGIEMGVLTNDMTGDQDTMRDGFDRIVERLDLMLGRLGVDLPDALGTLGNKGGIIIPGLTTQVEGVGDAVQDLIDDIADTGDAVEDLDERWKKAISGNTIVKENEKWDTSLSNIGLTIDDLKAAITNLGFKWDDVMGDMSGDTSTLQGLLADTQISLADLLGQLGAATTGDIGQHYGVYDQAEKEAMTLQFRQMGSLWEQSRATILSDPSHMAKFLRDLEGLKGGIIDENVDQYNRFLASIRNWNIHVQRGDIWDEATKKWTPAPGFASGTLLSGFKVPSGFDNDNFPVMVSSGETVHVTPRGRSGSDAAPGSIENLYMNLSIHAAPGGDSPESLADKFKYVLKNNVRGATTYLISKTGAA